VTTSPVLLNVSDVMQQNARISCRINGGLRNATKSNYWNVQISELLGVLAAFQTLFRCIWNLEPYSLEVTIIMFI